MKYIINLEKSLSIITNIEVSDAVRGTPIGISITFDLLIVKVRKSLKISKGSQKITIIFSSFMAYHRILAWVIRNVISGAGTAFPFGAHEFIPCL
jgi:hypothetical protein